jgi:hypothetical protein
MKRRTNLVRKTSARASIASPAVALPPFHSAPAPLPALATATVSSGHTPTSPPRVTPPPPASRDAPLQSPRNHASPSTEKRSHRHLPPPFEPSLPHPSASLIRASPSLLQPSGVPPRLRSRTSPPPLFVICAVNPGQAADPGRR